MAEDKELQRELEEALQQDKGQANHDPDVAPMQVISYGK